MSPEEEARLKALALKQEEEARQRRIAEKVASSEIVAYGQVMSSLVDFEKAAFDEAIAKGRGGGGGKELHVEIKPQSGIGAKSITGELARSGGHELWLHPLLLQVDVPLGILHVSALGLCEWYSNWSP